jgi:putative transcriptional regulator
MRVHHHPSDQSILAYANGSLSRPLALVMGVHAKGCAECRHALDLAEALGGLFLDAAPPVELSAGAFSNVLERLEIPADGPQSDPPVAAPFSMGHESIGSRRWLAPGIWIRPIVKDRSEGVRTYLLGAAPGKALPRHGHRGIEMTQVLEGEFFDGGVRYGPGDFLEAGDEVEHSLRVGTDAPCVCMIASEGVPDGIAGLLVRLMA